MPRDNIRRSGHTPHSDKNVLTICPTLPKPARSAAAVSITVEACRRLGWSEEEEGGEEEEEGEVEEEEETGKQKPHVSKVGLLTVHANIVKRP